MINHNENEDENEEQITFMKKLINIEAELKKKQNKTKKRTAQKKTRISTHFTDTAFVKIKIQITIAKPFYVLNEAAWSL